MNVPQSSDTSVPRAVVPSEVGWQFVPQYYTFVNKQPDRLHCFYTKKSTFIHGTEGEDGKPCHGQQEIHAKITSIGFEDCKVFIHSVDAQSSANGGIIIQVIGEMSNRGEPWRKFVQTFFLAEQPNGYFVLNDIFRFLKEETIDSDDVEESVAEPEEQPTPAAAAVPPPPAREPTPPPPPAVEPTPEPAPEAALPPVEEPTVTAPEPEPPVQQVPTPEPEPKTNGIHPVEPAAAPAPVAAVPPPAAAPQKPPPPPTEPAAPPKPAAPKTWANLAATNPKKWGTTVATESRGMTEVVPPASAPASGTVTPATTTAPSPASANARPPHPAFLAATSVTTPHCFIKGVLEVVTETQLRTELSRFGAVKEMDIVRSKACAFVEFTTVDAAKKAIINCLPASQGGGGGMWLVVDNDPGQVRITIETKKERGDRPPSRPRGGAPEIRGGSLRGRGGGRGRGAPKP